MIRLKFQGYRCTPDALSSLHGQSLEFTLTVPLSSLFDKNYFQKILLTLYFCLRVLTAAELDLFERGDPESINPELGVDEQADLLPYNRY